MLRLIINILNFNRSQKSIFIKYLDANNLYGWDMSWLPTHGFKSINKEELNIWKKHACILEVDLKYPVGLHNSHEYPLAPQGVMVNKVERLIPNVEDTTKYVVHREALKPWIENKNLHGYHIL